MALLSIIAPVYNVGPYLRRCLDSVLAQSFTDYELVLVDDGSTDDSPDICEAYARQDARIRVVHQENQGQAGARNTGLSAIRDDGSTFVSFIDTDDYLAPDMYATLIAAMDEQTDMVVSDFTMVRDDGMQFYRTFSAADDPLDTLSAMFRDGYGGLLWNKLLRKSVIFQNNMSVKDISPIADIEFVTRYICFARRVVKVDKSLYLYNMQNMTSITARTRRTDRYVNNFLKGWNLIREFLTERHLDGRFSREMNWRVQLLKSDLVLQPEEYPLYDSIWPEGNGYLRSNPFLHWKMRIAMWLLNHHVTWPVRAYASWVRRQAGKTE